MAAKILAGVVAALVVSGIGVYVAFSGASADQAGATDTLPVSEGSCCVQKTSRAISCTDSAECPLAAGQGCPAEALAACTGAMAIGAPAKTGKAQMAIGCCTD